MPRGLLPHELVSLAEADTFCAVIEQALSRLDYRHLSSIYLIGRGRRHHGIAISFDVAWKPFLGYTSGFNRNEREYVAAGCRILNVIGDWLRLVPRWQPGGRVFVSKEGASFDGEALATWDWNGECPVARLTRFRDSSRSDQQTVARKDCLEACRKAKQKEEEGDLPAADYYLKSAKNYLVKVDLEKDFESLKSLADDSYRIAREFKTELEQIVGRLRKHL